MLKYITKNRLMCKYLGCGLILIIFIFLINKLIPKQEGYDNKADDSVGYDIKEIGVDLKNQVGVMNSRTKLHSEKNRKHYANIIEGLKPCINDYKLEKTVEIAKKINSGWANNERYRKNPKEKKDYASIERDLANLYYLDHFEKNVLSECEKCIKTSANSSDGSVKDKGKQLFSMLTGSQ